MLDVGACRLIPSSTICVMGDRADARDVQNRNAGPYAPLVDRHSVARFRVRDGAVRAQRNTECRTSINVGSRDDDACVASKPVIRLVVSSPVGRCERHTHPSSEYRVRGRGR